MELKISSEVPPIYEKLHELFGVEWERGLIITYGDTIYTKDGRLSPALQRHEATHVRQQTKMGAEIWWEKYLSDPNFRKSQEAEAYRNQWQFIKQTVKNREDAFRKKLAIVGDFSGPMYGHICTSAEANQLLGK